MHPRIFIRVRSYDRPSVCPYDRFHKGKIENVSILAIKGRIYLPARVCFLSGRVPLRFFRFFCLGAPDFWLLNGRSAARLKSLQQFPATIPSLHQNLLFKLTFDL